MINFDELKSYKDYSKLTGPDIIEFMRSKPRDEIDNFKSFCTTKVVTHKTDGTSFEREPSFFEIRNWVLDKYYPGLTTPQKNKTVGHKLIDDILSL